MKHLLFATTAALLMACNASNASNEPPPAGAEPPVATAQPAVAAAASAPAVAAGTAADAAAGELTLVADSSQVCMVNNQFMGREQIPVQVDGKTYFGCCEMCKGRLANDPASRSAKDPVSGKLVDKAGAVIAKRASGEVVYFESQDTFKRYRNL